MWSRLIGMGTVVLVFGNSLLFAQNQQNQPAQNSDASRAAQDEQDSGGKLTFNGETALLTVAIRPDQTAEFERVLSRLQAALKASTDPERRKQAEGWKVIRLSTPLPDGNIAYIHVIDPVVPGAGYGVMQILYDAFPDERQQLYELYRAAFVRNVALAVGSVAVDMNGAASTTSPASQPSTPAPPTQGQPSPSQPTPGQPSPGQPSTQPGQ
jgi:hypothetical protein